MDGHEVLIAEPEKALVDYIYFKAYRTGKFDAEAERIDKTMFSRLNRKKIHGYAEAFGLDLKGLLYGYI